MIYCVIKEDTIIDYRTHPIGSVFYIEESFLGAFFNYEDAENYIWNSIDDYVKSFNITSSMSKQGKNIVFKHTNEEETIFSIKEIKSDEFIELLYSKFKL